ncbi:MAG: DUF721 domain-containing protein [Desulfuromonadales bacterium]|nr:DUF721 domain-containing protein [Desulfuromonadales bacterium]
MTERVRMKKPLSVSDILATAFSGKPTEKRLQEVYIWRFWDKAVGEQIAAKAYPAAFRDGILTVRVSSSPWMQQLTFLKSDIIVGLNQEIGKQLVKDIFFKQGKITRADQKTFYKETPKPPLTDKEKNWVNERAESVKDEELKELFVNLISKHLSDSL